MKLDFEKFLNDNGLKIGDRVKLSDGDVYEICRGEDKIFSLRNEREDINYVLSLLEMYDFEKVEKKVGDLFCGSANCRECPLYCVNCSRGSGITIREKFETTLEIFPELQLMRGYFETELDKEVEE